MKGQKGFMTERTVLEERRITELAATEELVFRHDPKEAEQLAWLEDEIIGALATVGPSHPATRRLEHAARIARMLIKRDALENQNHAELYEAVRAG